jgi:uncharacterized protein (TIGR03663 family)
MQQSPEAKDSSSVKQYFELTEWIVFCLLIFLGLALRWIALDARPVHHDESLHMMYGRYFYDFPNEQFYRYDPMLHGPFLYNALRVVYSTLGSSTEAARSLTALLGSMFIFLPLLFRRFLSKDAVIFLTAAVALSPTLTYWSRFIREDIPVLFALAILLYGCTLARPQYRWILALISFSLQICMKENVFVTGALLLGYLVYESFVNKVFYRERDCLWQRCIDNLSRYKIQALLGLLIAAAIYTYLYSAGFRYWKGPGEFWTRSFSYWAEQHGIERIKGPFNFHFYVLSWYELPFIILCFASVIRFYRKGHLVLRVLGGGFSLLAVGAALAYWNKPVDGVFPWSLAKLKDAYDILGLIFLTPHAVLITTDHLIKRERALAFWCYLFLATFFTYSYLGEKVPWLAVYPFTPGLIYLALLFDHHYRTQPIADWRNFPLQKILAPVGMTLMALALLFTWNEGFAVDIIFILALGTLILGASLLTRVPGLIRTINLKHFLLICFCLYSLRANILTNFVYAGKSREYISQVHTTHEFHKLVKSIRLEAETAKLGYEPLIFGSGDVVWPITWYLVDIPEYRFIASNEERKNYKYQFINHIQNQSEIPSGFRAVTVNLRGWWVPDFSKMTLRNFLNYAINHTPWGDTGYTYVTFLVRETDPPQQRLR